MAVQWGEYDHQDEGIYLILFSFVSFNDEIDLFWFLCFQLTNFKKIYSRA